MNNNDKIMLNQEYIQRFSKFKYWIARAAGYGRFGIKNHRIVEKSWVSVIYGALMAITTTVTVIHIIYETSVRTHYLLYTELVIFLELAVIIELILLNVTFGSRYNVAKLIKHSIEIDLLLGVKDTKFMRDITDSGYTVMSLPVLVVQLTVVIFMYFTFDVSMLVHVTGSIYFLWAFCVFYDINYSMVHASFLNLRTRYLNVALMKTIDVNVEYIPDFFMFNGVFWKTKHNDLVKFHETADLNKFLKTYKMLFKHSDLFVKGYQFTIIVEIMCITVGSLLCVQTVIIYGKTGMDMLRKYVIVSWLVMTWAFVILISLLVDIFARQIEQTKLICTYAQLKAINDDRIYKWTKSVFRALEIRDARASIYGLFFFNPGMMLRLAASTFVYITAQLQIAMATPEENNFVTNVTNANQNSASL